MWGICSSGPTHSAPHGVTIRWLRRVLGSIFGPARVGTEVGFQADNSRQGDLVVHNADGVRHWVVDVTCVHPRTGDASRAAADRAEKAKLRADAAYGERSLRRRGHLFVPFGVESSGGLGPQADRFLRRCARLAVERRRRIGGQLADEVCWLAGEGQMRAALVLRWKQELCALQHSTRAASTRAGLLLPVRRGNFGRRE